MPQTVMDACTGLKLDLIFFITAFLWIAFVIAVLGALFEVISRVITFFSKPTAAPALEGIDVDPVKLIDALKGLIETLARAPAWIAMFLAALALLGVTSLAMPEYCRPAAPPAATAAPPAQAGQPAPPAGTSQAPAARP